MSHHTATLQFTFDKTATAFDFACTVADRLYWLDDNYIQPFYSWAAPRLRDVAISGINWGLMALIDVAIWLTDTTLQFMARDAHAIALDAFAQVHAPLPEFPALSPATVPLALPFALPMAPAPDLTADDDVDRAIIIYPTVVPFAFSQFITPGDSIERWLTSALPLVPSLTLESAPVVAEAVPVASSVAEDALVVPKSQKKTDSDKAIGKKIHKQLISAHSEHSSEHTIPTLTNLNTTAKTPRKRSPKTKKTATAQ